MHEGQVVIVDPGGSAYWSGRLGVVDRFPEQLPDMVWVVIGEKESIMTMQSSCKPYSKEAS